MSVSSQELLRLFASEITGLSSGIDINHRDTLYSSRWQSDHCVSPNPHLLQLEHPAARSASETEITVPTIDNTL
ncbi:MAG: hypothetical protein J07HQW1_00174 [Haloquadratum walsbyi J07HQW1]|uniref:Uncharacterized protein n=1 Tax=Haloquadratum walsbyi J07HQW1 TaxID=1238424 RepID=U1N115_9EURY|nr:MAG: hypothetical protein J07HQW1_00174 [Haloquadratum walsbyi J07HQW1]